MSETIRRLAEDGIEVEVLAPSYRGLGLQVVHGVKVHRFRYAPASLETLTHDQTTPDRIRERPLYLGLVPSYIVAGSIAASRLAGSGRFDVLHAFWPLPHGLFGLLAKRAGVPLVSTFFGVELTWMRRQLPFLAPLMRRIVRGSDAVTVISSHTANELRAIAPDADVRVIPFGAASAPERAASEEAPLPAGRPFTLLFVGRLVERKGVHVLLHALASLPQDDVRLWVVGDGPERGRLEQLSEELHLGGRVEFTGTVDGGELRRRMQRCDAVVLPAIRDAKGDVEGLGVVLIEALGYGKPVIASESGGIPDIVENERTGLLVPPGEPGPLAAAIGRLQADSALARRLAGAGQAHVAERFSWERIVSDLTGVYRAVADSSAVRAPETTR